jgi:hypothetical protein
VSGSIAVTNSKAGGALIKGDLTIPEARYQIIRQGAAEVPELTGVRRRTDVMNASAAKPAESAVPSNWKLDVRIRADNKIFVSGMGLEAEWATDLRDRRHRNARSAGDRQSVGGARHLQLRRTPLRSGRGRRGHGSKVVLSPIRSSICRRPPRSMG